MLIYGHPVNGGKNMIYHYAVNLTGPYHKVFSTPCQDAYSIDKTDNYTIVAVADGVSSVSKSDVGAQIATKSDVGAQIATKSAVEHCTAYITSSMSDDEIILTMKQAYIKAYTDVLYKAKEDGIDEEEYDSTMCMAIYDGTKLYFSNSGDSGIIALYSDGEIEAITTQQRDEEGRVYPLCRGPEFWEFGVIDRPVSAVAAMTDGILDQICHPVLIKNNMINVPLCMKFMNHFDCIEDDIPALEIAASKYLENIPNIDDDKTIVVVWDSNNTPARRERSYYAIPDWDALNTKSDIPDEA